ncbi:MAG: TonB-dependent receptor [Chakrabartia sp.]
MNRKIEDSLRVSLFALIGGWSCAANAQDAAPAENAAETEIVVTAQKREQLLTDVPISITAISGDALAKRGASTIEDLQYAVSGVSITQFSPGQQRVQMRGVSVFSGLPTVGVYLDEMPLNLESNQTGQDVRLLDIKRLEVLRGPQGTLYGQGAVGGSIRYITNDVDLNSVTGSASGEVAAIDGGGVNWKGDAVVNVPLSEDRVGLRLAGSYQRFGGWIDNPLLGDKRVNSGHSYALRGKLRFDLSDAFRIVLTAQHQDLKLGANNLSDGAQQVFDTVPTPFTSRATLLNGLATYDFGGVTLLSSSSYIKRKDVLIYDLTPTLGPFIPLLTGAPTPPGTTVATTQPRTAEVFSQEVRLSSNGEGPFIWTVGGFFRDSKSRINASSTVTPNILPPGLTLFASSGTSPEDSRSWAVFGEGSYELSDTLTALVGLRYFEDRRTQDAVSTIFGATAIDKQQATFTALSPRFNLSWQPNDRVNIYANVGKGFRSGGFNVTSSGGGAAVPGSFTPDVLWTYELGAKFQSDDRKFSADLAVYRNVWNDVQSVTNIPGLPTNFTTNSGKITGWGVDGSLSYVPLPGLTLSLTGGWNNMTYRTNTADHLVGDPADYVPRFTGSASAEYRFDLGSVKSFVRVDYQHADRYQAFFRNFSPAPVFSDPQDILNTQVGISGSNWSGTFFIRNLLNRDSVIYPAFASLINPARLQPRSIGVSFSINY